MEDDYCCLPLGFVWDFTVILKLLYHMGQALASLFFRTNGWTVDRFYVILSHDNLCIAVLAPGRRSALYAAVAGMMDQQKDGH